MSDQELRDTFAAAALSGLLVSREWPIDGGEAAAYCYRVADAMLRERATTIHDAAPAARASVDSVATQPTTEGGRERTDKSPARTVDGTGESDRPKPIKSTPGDATPGDGTERRECTEPVAWAVWDDPLEPTVCMMEGDAIEFARVNGGAEVSPLYHSPTLTEAEREAVEIAVEYVGSAYQVEHYAAVLRGLLERLK